MPELPEVETIRKGLEKHVVGHTIEDIELRLPKQLRGDYQKIIGAKIIGAKRYGKGLIIELDNDFSLAVHVKMTGQLVFSRLPLVIGKYTHVIFYLDHDKALLYNDMRQFGWIHILPTSEVLDLLFFKRLGPEPLKDLTFSEFQTILQRYKTPIKLLIMDQSKIAGVGNIYANDALYLAKIHPKRQANSLSSKEQHALFDAIEQVLRKGIEVGGASEWHYVDVLGGKGSYQDFFQVYRKNGTACPRCGATIEKMKLGGRGTFFCTVCQK